MLAKYDKFMQGMLSIVRDRLIVPGESLFKHFQQHSQAYNLFNKMAHHGCRSEFIRGGGPTIASMNGEVCFTLSEPVPSNPDRLPTLGNWMAMDPASAIASMQNDPRYRNVFEDLRRDILSAINAELRRDNPMAQAYSTMGEQLRAYMADHNNELPRYRMIFMPQQRRGTQVDEDGNPVRNATDIPMAGGQQILLWHATNGDSVAPKFTGTWLCHNGNFVELGKWDPLALAASFPIIFGNAEPWWHSGMRTATGLQPQQTGDEAATVNGEEDALQETIVDDDLLEEEAEQVQRRARRGEFISLREFLIFMLWVRPYHDHVGNPHGESFSTTPHFAFSTGKIAQQFVNVAGAQVKTRQAEAHARHQEEEIRVRTAMSAEHQAYLTQQIRRQFPDAELGRYIYNPKSIPGSRRYYQEKYTNLLSLKAELGRNPDWFLTVTMNLNHPQVLAQLPRGADPLDHPDVVTRVWREIWAKVISDVVDKGRLGKCVASAIVREHQGRGAPHAHMLVWVEDCPGKSTADWLDDYVSAEFVDNVPPGATGDAAEQQKLMLRLQSELMVHRHNEDSNCMVDGRCKRFFPKQFSEQTILNAHRFPTYRRRVPPPENVLDAREEALDTLEADPEAITYRRRPPVPRGTVNMTPAERERYGNSILKRVGNAMIEVDNSMVVPTNLAMLAEYRMHVCLEYVGSSSTFHYMCDYCCKGAPLIPVRVERERQEENQVVDVNEIAYETSMRYTTATEQLCDLTQTPLFRFPGGWTFNELYVTMPGHDRVWFPEGDPEQARPMRNALHAYFRLNQRLADQGDTSASHHTFATLSQEFRFVNGEWRQRARPNPLLISRIGRVPEQNQEAQSLRLLLIHVPSPTSYNHLKRLPTDPSDIADEVLEARTFTDAARARGLLDSAEIWIQTLRDAFMERSMQAERDRCRFFAVTLRNASAPDIPRIFDSIIDDMIIPPVDADPATNRPGRRQRALNWIEYYLNRAFNAHCVDLGLDQPARYNFTQMDTEEQRLDDQEDAPEGGYVGTSQRATNPTPNSTARWAQISEANQARMTLEQLDVFDTVMESILEVNANPLTAQVPRYFMNEGPGGVGKTTINETLIAECRRRGLNVVATASTGVAANLLPTGSTLHSALLVPRDVTAETRPKLESEPIKARLRRIDLLIVDEVSMLHRHVLEYVDRQLRDLWAHDNARRNMPFGGVVVLLTGNWAQLKPVVPRGDENATREASIRMSELFTQNFTEFQLRQNMRVLPGERDHAEWLEQLGRGQNFHSIPARTVLIPEACRCNSAAELINFVFPPHLLNDPIANVEELRQGAILAPHRETVTRLNRTLIQSMPGEWLILDGFDHLVRAGNRPRPWDVNQADADIENIHNRQPSGFPPYRLRMKVGSICVMLTNYDPMAGLFNGTRVQVLGTVGENLLRLRILDGRSRHVGQTRIIARARFEYGRAIGERDIPFTRDQFPLDPAFFMTYNKAQGQSLPRCGLWNWDSQPFADGMFYTGCSRSTSAAGLKIFSSLRDFTTVNKVDFQLLGVRPRTAPIAAPPPPPPAAPEPMDTTAPPPDERPPEQPLDAGEPMEVDPQPDQGEDGQQGGGTIVPPEGVATAEQSESEAPRATPPPPPPQPTTQNPPNPPTGGASSGRLFMRL
jgi:hypothetical protein